MTHVTIISENVSFKGQGQKLENFKAQVSANIDNIGTIVAETVFTYTVKFGSKTVKLPKTWIQIL